MELYGPVVDILIDITNIGIFLIYTLKKNKYYGKEAGEISIYSVYVKEYQDIQANKEYHDTKLKGDYKMLTYYRFDKVDMSRLVEPGSVDHRGYFKVIDVK